MLIDGERKRADAKLGIAVVVVDHKLLSRVQTQAVDTEVGPDQVGGDRMPRKANMARQTANTGPVLQHVFLRR